MLESDNKVMSKEEFMQQYVLARVRTIGWENRAVVDERSIVIEAHRAYSDIRDCC